ncbi:DNA-binding response regulator, NarL/FixJ family, contains REC and HTH domains [Aromatoleum tolulyticum]|uniref:DNA-binding response regulator, NarL/FixJ family, contains REC and HTH domains n=1 Tax=Aromatoleum tolulyticum TaxID=34027 RepID=A0A1N7B1U8_9RHOO|nr:response regulator transcription factor [Aromatoleum tolulyticum]SIR45320.1 DNA-binding response regulator, NarL/FixJ family, contains REC and HTH domains [Aromatoleum tolulyticum]
MIEVTERPIRVFLVDDHRATLWGLERLVGTAQRMQLAGSATSIAELLASPESREADVIVIDLDLGGHDSSDSFAELLSTYGAKVLVLTGARDLDAHRRAVLAGARGVVRKEEPVDVLLRAIEKVHEGDVWVNRALIGDIMNMLTGKKKAAAPDDARIATLTPKEVEVIGAVVRYKGAKSLVIADDLGISEHTLRNHLTAIYHKLEVHGRLELYLYAKERCIGTVAQ